MPKFSIITPSYNSWQCMERYWKSLEGQTYKDFEVIIVDDCSKDDTFKKIQEYANKSKIKINALQNSKNHGPGYSRNRGMKEATGEWLTFIDSDDWIDEHLLEKIVGVLEQDNHSINCFVYDYNIVRGKEITPSSSVYGNIRGGLLQTTTCIAKVRNHTFGKFYRTDLVKRVGFPELKRCEDVAFVCQAIDACCMDGNVQTGCTFYIKEALYYYDQRPGSLSNAKSLDATDMVTAYKIIREKLGEKYPNEILSKSVPDLLYGGTLMMCKAGKTNHDIREFIRDYV